MPITSNLFKNFIIPKKKFTICHQFQNKIITIVFLLHFFVFSYSDEIEFVDKYESCGEI